MRSLKMEQKTEDILNEINDLLVASNLVPVQLESDKLYFFCHKDKAGKIIGVIGVELYGTSSLLRSLAVSFERRNEGIGHSLLKEALAFAKSIASYDVYLITETIADTMQDYGFCDVAREKMPAAMLKSPYLNGICPCSARIMYINILKDKEEKLYD